MAPLIAIAPRPPELRPPPSASAGPSSTPLITPGAAGVPGAAGAAGAMSPERKRGRKRYSCAECRRLKLKCSKSWPCTMCERRGCASLCPEGEKERERKRPGPVGETEEATKEQLQYRIAVLEAALHEGGERSKIRRPSHSQHPQPMQGRDRNGSLSHPLAHTPHASHRGFPEKLLQPREPHREHRNGDHRNTDHRNGGHPNGDRRHEHPDPRHTSADSASSEERVVDSAPGSLVIGRGGEARYVGSLAGSAYLREPERRGSTSPTTTSNGHAHHAPHAVRTQGANSPVNLVINGEHSHPLSSPLSPLFSSPSAHAPSALNGRRGTPGAPGDPTILRLRARLPDWEEEGRGMVESYWDHVNWIHQLIPRSTFETEYLPSAYSDTPHPHRLACVFLAMALGVLFDIARPPFHPRGKELFLLGRECIEATRREKAGTATVQALTMLGTFILNDNDSNGSEIYWPILGDAVKTALSVGLHRDGEAFGLPPRVVEERRKAHWELMEYDRTQALSFGRPCGLSNRHADTQFPASDGTLFQDASGYHHAKHRLVHMMERVVDIQVQPTPVPYSAVVRLDAELQEFRKSLPESLMCSVAIQDLPLDTTQHPHLVLQRFGIRLFVAEARLHLNRAALVHALRSHPHAPSHGPFSAAFVAAYESAQEIVQVVKQLVLYSPALAERWWFFWFHVFSAAVCLAAISIQAPRCGFATPALSGLGIVCDLSAAARDGCRVKDGLGTLLALRARARDRLAEAAREPKAGSEGSDDGRPRSSSDGDAMLHRLLLAERPRRASGEERPGSAGSGAGSGAGSAPASAGSASASGSNGVVAQSLIGSLGLEDIWPMAEGAAEGGVAVPPMPLWPDAASVLIDYGVHLG